MYSKHFGDVELFPVEGHVKVWASSFHATDETQLRACVTPPVVPQIEPMPEVLFRLEEDGQQ